MHRIMKKLCGDKFFKIMEYFPQIYSCIPFPTTVCLLVVKHHKPLSGSILPEEINDVEENILFSM